MYYACLEFKAESHGKDGNKRVVKTAFEKREDARAYIEQNFNPDLHTSCWTE